MAGELDQVIDDLWNAMPGGEITTPHLPIKICPHGVLIYEPKNSPIEQMIDEFLANRPVFVRLEPGDATRYDLLLTPIGSRTATRDFLAGHGLFEAGYFRKWAVLSQLNSQRKTLFVSLSNQIQRNWFLDDLDYQNDYTKLAICWFVGYFSYLLHNTRRSA